MPQNPIQVGENSFTISLEPSLNRYEPKKNQKRDEIVFGRAVDWENRKFPPGVCERFEELDAKAVEKLLELGFMSLSQTMNATPTVESFLEFANEMEQKGFTFKFEGFAFDPRFEKNQDVILEGIYYEGDYSAEIVSLSQSLFLLTAQMN